LDGLGPLPRGRGSVSAPDRAATARERPHLARAAPPYAGAKRTHHGQAARRCTRIR
jgi:hypothetical protein